MNSSHYTVNAVDLGHWETGKAQSALRLSLGISGEEEFHDRVFTYLKCARTMPEYSYARK